MKVPGIKYGKNCAYSDQDETLPEKKHSGGKSVLSRKEYIIWDIDTKRQSF